MRVGVGSLGSQGGRVRSGSGLGSESGLGLLISGSGRLQGGGLSYLPSDSSMRASARLAPREIVRSAAQCGSTAWARLAPKSCGVPFLKSGDAVTKASTCSG